MTRILPDIAAGRQAAVAECIDTYGPMVWRLARRYLDRADAHVDDAVQEIFVEVWLAADRFDPARGAERSFVATIAHRRLIDYQRRVTVRRRTDRQAPPRDEAPERLEERLSGPDQVELASAFDGLPPDERNALWLSVHRGLTHREIGEATNVPIGTVKSRLRRGLLRLRDALQRAVPQTSEVDG